MHDKPSILLTFERIFSLLQSSSFEPEVLDNVQAELETARDTLYRVEHILHQGPGTHSIDVDSTTGDSVTPDALIAGARVSRGLHIPLISTRQLQAITTFHLFF